MGSARMLWCGARPAAGHQPVPLQVAIRLCFLASYGRMAMASYAVRSFCDLWLSATATVANLIELQGPRAYDRMNMHMGIEMVCVGPT